MCICHRPVILGLVFSRVWQGTGPPCRVISPLAGVWVEMPGFVDGHSAALDCNIGSKRQYREEMKKAEEEYNRENPEQNVRFVPKD